MTEYWIGWGLRFESLGGLIAFIIFAAAVGAVVVWWLWVGLVVAVSQIKKRMRRPSVPTIADGEDFDMVLLGVALTESLARNGFENDNNEEEEEETEHRRQRAPARVEAGGTSRVRDWG